MTDTPKQWRMVPADSLRRLSQDILGGVWRRCRPCFERDGKIEGWPSFSMADLHEIAASPAPDLEGLRERVARVMVDRTGAGTLGLTDEASMTAARPIAAEIVALIFTPEGEGRE